LSPQPTPDPFNPFCAGGPRSITVTVRGQKNPENSSARQNPGSFSVKEKFESKAVERLVKKALTNQDVKQEYARIERRIEKGVHPVDIGKKSTMIRGVRNNGIVWVKGKNSRYVVEVFKDRVDVLGIGVRGNEKSMQTFQDLMNELYGLNFQY